MAVQVNRLTQANVFLNGNTLLGTCESFDIPFPKAKMSEHKAIGMIGDLELPSGMDKLEAKFKWNSFYQDVLVATSDIYARHRLTVRGNLETYEGSERVNETPVKVFLEGSFKHAGDPKFNKADNVEIEATFNVLKITLEVGDAQVFSYDSVGNIYIVGGEDKLAAYRANLGI